MPPLPESVIVQAPPLHTHAQMSPQEERHYIVREVLKALGQAPILDNGTCHWSPHFEQYLVEVIFPQYTRYLSVPLSTLVTTKATSSLTFYRLD